MAPYIENGRGRQNSEGPYRGQELAGSRDEGWHCGYLGICESSPVSSKGYLPNRDRKMGITEHGHQDFLTAGG